MPLPWLLALAEPPAMVTEIGAVDAWKVRRSLLWPAATSMLATGPATLKVTRRRSAAVTDSPAGTAAPRVRASSPVDSERWTWTPQLSARRPGT